MYGPAFDQLPDDHPCKRARKLRAALDDLMSGKAEAMTRDGDAWLAFQKGDAKTLRAELTRAERECNVLCGGTNAVRSGPPQVPNGCIPFGPFGYRRGPYGGRY